MKKDKLQEIIEEVVKERLEQIVQEKLDLALKDEIRGIESVKEKISNLQEYIRAISALPIQFDVEAQLYELAEKTGVRTELLAFASIMGVKYFASYYMGKDIVIAKIPEKEAVEFLVKKNSRYILLGIKLIDGEGYGSWSLWEGWGRVKFLGNLFTRGKNQKEVSTALPPYKLEPDCYFSVKHDEGQGDVTIALIGYSARPSVFLSAIKVETTENER